MIKNFCNHVWSEPKNGESICMVCAQHISVSELYQLEALINQTKSVENQTKLAEHQLGFQKWLSIIALIVSIIAVVISTLSALK